MPSQFAALACAVSLLHGEPLQVASTPQWPLYIHAKTGAADIFTTENSTVTYRDGVKVVYGYTVITCDSLFVDRLAQKAVAKGNVHVQDPDAVIDAQELVFTWTTKQESGHLESMSGTFEGLSIEAGSADVAPSGLILNHALIGPANRNHKYYTIEARRLTFVAGKYLRIENPTFRVFGWEIPWHRTLTFSEDPRVHSGGLPAFGMSNGAAGVNYAPTVLIDQQTVVQSWLDVYQGAVPHYGIQLSHTFLSPKIPNQGRIVPSSDLDTRFGFGYFDNVLVRSPEDEAKAQRALRSSVGVDSEVNQGASDRLPGGTVTKAGEVVYENGGPLGPLGHISHIRFQDVREEGEQAFKARFVVDTSVGVPPIHLFPGVESDIRMDAQGFAGRNTFGWARAQLGLAVQPFAPIRIAAAYVTATESGTPDLTTDRLYDNGAWCFRGDAYFGSIRASYLARYYLSGAMFDDEYEVSQAIGAFRVAVIYRRFPSDFRIGVTFRLDDMLDSIRRHHTPSAKNPLPVEEGSERP